MATVGHARAPIRHVTDLSRIVPDRGLGFVLPGQGRLTPAASPFLKCGVAHPAWVAANDGDLANRTDVFHRTAG